MSGLPGNLRTFTAVELSAAVRRAVREDCEPLLQGAGKLSVVREENLHVTLKFVGDVQREEVADLGEAVADAARLLVPGEIEIEGLGGFPNLDRPRVIWAGVSDPGGILTPVHARLNDTLRRFRAKREVKRYVPHVTLARVRGRFDADRFEEGLERLGEAWFGAQEVSSITLFMSELERGAPPRYTVLGRYGPGGS